MTQQDQLENKRKITISKTIPRSIMCSLLGRERRDYRVFDHFRNLI